MYNLFRFILFARNNCRCGRCRKYTLEKLTNCKVFNTICYGMGGMIEDIIKTKTRLCNKCLIEAKKRKVIIKIYK